MTLLLVPRWLPGLLLGFLRVCFLLASCLLLARFCLLLACFLLALARLLLASCLLLICFLLSSYLRLASFLLASGSNQAQPRASIATRFPSLAFQVVISIGE